MDYIFNFEGDLISKDEYDKLYKRLSEQQANAQIESLNETRNDLKYFVELCGGGENTIRIPNM